MLRPSSRQLIEKFLDGMFAAGTSSDDLISDDFLDSTFETEVGGRTLFLDQCRQLNHDCHIRHRSRAWGRDIVISYIRIYDRSSPDKLLSQQLWSWSVEDGKITARSVMNSPHSHSFGTKLFASFRLLRAAIIVDVLFGCGVLCPQGLEILRMMAGAPGDRIPYSLLIDSITWTFSLAVSLFLFSVLRIAMPVMHPIVVARRGIPRFWAPEIDQRLLCPPLLVAAPPFVVLGVALWISSYSVGEMPIVLHMRFWAVVQLAVAGTCLIFCIAVSRVKGLLPGKKLRFWAVLSLASTFVVAGILSGSDLDGLAAIPAVLSFRLTLLLALLGLGAWMADVFRLPVLKIVTVWILALALLGWDDHHTINTIAINPSRGSMASGPVADVFSQWLKDRHDDTSGHFATIIVTAEGGGIRAAVMTARVLHELSSRYPTFSHHLFAIVGVSGGSLGAAAYAASVHDPGKGDWQKSFDSDMVSPVIRSLLGVDFLSRFVPRWLVDLSPHDRAHALEAAWTGNWQRETGKDIRRLSFGDLRPTRYSDQPALVLLTTSTKTGERMAISHLTFPAPSSGKNANSTVRTLADELPRADVPLATAAFMSARFPLVSPPARLPGTGEPRRYVDGGYYENSGVSTALDIVHGIEVEAAGKANILVIRIENGEVAEKRDETELFPLIDLRQPVEALYRAGNAHAEAAIRQLHDDIRRSTACQSQAACVPLREAVFRLNPTNRPLPLGWFITGPARDEIGRQVEQENADGFLKVKEALGGVPVAAPL